MRLPFEYEINHHNLKILEESIILPYKLPNKIYRYVQHGIKQYLNYSFLTIYLSPFLKMLNEDNNGRGNEELS